MVNMVLWMEGIKMKCIRIQIRTTLERLLSQMLIGMKGEMYD